MGELERLLKKKKELLDQICKLKDMRQGSVVEQYFETKRKDGTMSRQGPYFLYSYKEGGKTISRRLPSVFAAESYREQIGEFRKFEQLCSQLAETCQRLSDIRIEEGFGDNTQEKKLRRPSSRRSKRKLKG